jgi:hypothetical protein
MSNYAAIWESVSAILKSAFQAVPEPVRLEMRNEFFEYLDHNELELAWDVLAELGAHAGQAFWLQLHRAAREMQLPGKAQAAMEKARLVA